MSIDNGGAIDRLLAEWKRRYPDGMPADEVRQRAIDFVVSQLPPLVGRAARPFIEAAYDRFMDEPGAPTEEPKAEQCWECGLNDGHHYRACSQA